MVLHGQRDGNQFHRKTGPSSLASINSDPNLVQLRRYGFAVRAVQGSSNRGSQPLDKKFHYWRQSVFYRPLTDTAKTYVTGLWLVDGNVKRSREEYLALLPRTLRFLQDQNVVIYYDDDEVLRIVKKFHFNNIKTVRRALLELPKYEQAWKVACNTAEFDYAGFSFRSREKGLAHYAREYMFGGPDVYANMLAVWLSKIDLVCEQVAAGAGHYSWIDASVARFCPTRSMKGMIDLAKSDVLRMYPSSMAYLGEQIKFNASYMMGPSAKWPVLQSNFDRQLEHMLHEKYPIDEEVVLHCINSNGLIQVI